MARAVSKKRTSKAAAKKGATRKAPARRPSRPRGFKLCIDFGLFPDDTVLGPSFSLAGFAFSQVAGADMVVNITEGEKGLGFPDQGMRVAPPTAVSSVSMRIGTFAGPVQIAARDAQGNQVAAQSAAFNAFGNVTMTSRGRNIATLEFAGGNNEALLVELCIDVATASE